MMEFSEYKEQFRKAWKRERAALALTDTTNPLREGQVAWNELYDVRPDICRKIMQGSRGIDPFSDNSRIPAFLRFVEENW